ncbi:MAG: cysteine hydrolase [Alphaproteobacteria bacterium]|nr:cysteine hydrolase [Alphaproteobacteria bacterium]
MHVCVDMQRLFAEATDWHVPSFDAVLPNVLRLARARPERAIYTRFLVPEDPEAADGAWRDHYQRWSEMTLQSLDPALQDLVAPLRALVPPGLVADKMTYSAFVSGDFIKVLAGIGGETLIFSGVETDVCVLATVLSAVDRGYRVIVARDAVTGSSLPAHGAMLEQIYPRLPDQIALLTTEEIVRAWRNP